MNTISIVLLVAAVLTAAVIGGVIVVGILLNTAGKIFPEEEK
jgi:hypothetical protein